jgi:uncharacterized protein (UPF0276 family)
MMDVQSEFEERAGMIPVHGIGLSVDLYSPDLLALDEHLCRHGIVVEYYELFEAALPALVWASNRLADRRLAYHGEGLWVSQPDFSAAGGRAAVSRVCAQLRALDSYWLNLECATKHIAGHSFGTYLPPLYTEAGALVAAENAAVLQQQLDREFFAAGVRPPLLLLEMPPLTYFACGSLAIPEFFAQLVRRTSCGLVLDIGHLWTVYRYTGAWRDQRLDHFVRDFVTRFPMDRVVEIHVAGLAPHPAEAAAPNANGDGAGLPRWIDAHGAPIPPVLFDMVDQVLSDRRLVSLKGLALEVDTKDPSLIVSETQAFLNRYGTWRARLSEVMPSTGSDLASVHQASVEAGSEPARLGSGSYERRAAERRTALARDYEFYARVVSGQAQSALLPESMGQISNEDGLGYYRQAYLPYELLHWGGDLRDMFPRTHDLMRAGTVDVADFVQFWFSRPGCGPDFYDFFLVKIDRFVQFIASVLPSAWPTVAHEAEELRAAYAAANQPADAEGVST